jgi:ubiquinone/menaquinone biosynthesis C-methylase UbiE
MNTELFTGKAEAYADSRPSYPDSAVEYILSLASPIAIFADIGAGTGKFTELLAKRGLSVYAVEPNSDMSVLLAAVSSGYPNVRTVSASAEATTLPDNCVDVITCEQAMHWFEPDAFKAECRRIGKEGCILVSIYNVTPGGSSPTHSETAKQTYFSNPIIKEFPNPIYYTREKWLAYMTSPSHDPLPSDPKYAAHIAEMNAVFDKENVDGLLCRDVVTRVCSEKNHQ